jgi:hypothetical protein
MKRIISLLCIALLVVVFVGCGSSSKLSSDEKSIMNNSYDELSIDQKVVFENLIRRNDLTEKDVKDIKTYINTISDTYLKKSFLQTINHTGAVETPTTATPSPTDTPQEVKATLSDEAIKTTVETLKRDYLVKDVSIITKDSTINIAIQANAAINKNKAKDLIDTAIRQVGSNAGGRVPTKDYYGEIWDGYDAHVRIFSGQSNTILDGYMNKGENKITY